MKKFLLGTAALVALGVPAIAADMPARPITHYAPAFTWTGCYLGVNIGYATGTSEQTSEGGSVLIGTGTFGPFGPPAGLSATSPLPQAPFVFGQGAAIAPNYRVGGILGGGTAGCQYQAGAWVFGIEGDGGPAKIEGQANDLLPFNPQYVNQTDERWFATLRGRIGYAVDKWLFYATGGVAWARVDERAWNGCNAFATATLGTTFPACAAGINGPFPATAVGTPAGVPMITDSKTMAGYAVGAGVEYALGYGWSIKSEYIYIDFGSKDFFNPGQAISCCVTPTFVSPTRVRLYDHTFKWGLNYKFDWGYWGKGVAAVTK